MNQTAIPQTANDVIMSAVVSGAKRKYTKGPKWKAYIKRLKQGKKTTEKEPYAKAKKHKCLTLAQADYKYLRFIGHGLHHIENKKKNCKEIWQSTKTPTACAMKLKNSYIEFRHECAPTIKGINA
jgi:hypothetical protein